MTSKHEEYATKMKAEIDALVARIKTLQAKVHDAKLEARGTYQAELAKLRHQSKLAMTQLGKLKDAGEDSWDMMVAEMDKIRDAFKHSFNYFKSQL